MNFKAAASCFLLGAGLALSPPASAALIADWGVIAIGSETSFRFTPYDATTNFTDQYSFALAASTAITYSTESFLAVCTRGCGNPVLEFGIYDATGGLLDASGSVTLGPGSYAFQIRGTGMGSGNAAGTGGLISFYSAAPELVSPTPEPSAWMLMLSGLAAIGLRMRRRESAAARCAASPQGGQPCQE